MTEIWKNIEGYEGYQISNFGNVKSLSRYSENGRLLKERIMKKSKEKKGYLCVRLTKKGVSKYFKIHRLVAQAFIPNPDNLPQVNHKDENKTNNCVENLEWCTNDYNIHYGTGRKRANTTCIYNAKLGKKVSMFSKDGEYIKTFSSCRNAWRETGIDYSQISACAKSRKDYKTAGGFIWRYAS